MTRYMVAPPTASTTVAGNFCLKSCQTVLPVMIEMPKHGAGHW